MGRIICIGDVHGCYSEMLRLLDELAITSNDRVIFAGDFLDKGPESVKCLQLARTMGFESVLGNHESKYIRYQRHEQRVAKDPKYVNPMHFKAECVDIYKELAPEDFEWMLSLPLSLELLPNVFLVHAGLLPSEDPRKPSDSVLRIRWVQDGLEKMQPLLDATDLWNPSPGSSWWTQRYLGKDSLVYGHASRSFANAFVEKAPGGAWTYGIDTGCVYGGSLTAALFDKEDWPIPSFYSVKAERAYTTAASGGPS